MNKKRLRRIKLVPAPTLSAFEEMCQLFGLDTQQDHTTKKLRAWHRPCHQQLLVF